MLLVRVVLPLVVIVLCTSCLASNPQFDHALIAPFVQSPYGNESIWWDPVNLRVRVSKFDAAGPKEPTSTFLGFCDKDQQQFTSWSIVYTGGNVYSCTKFHPVPCEYANFTNQISANSDTAAMLATGIPASAQFLGEASNCSLAGTCENYYQPNGDGCTADGPVYSQWIVSQTTLYGAVLQSFNTIHVNRPFGRCYAYPLLTQFGELQMETPSQEDIEIFITTLSACQQ